MKGTSPSARPKGISVILMIAACALGAGVAVLIRQLQLDRPGKHQSSPNAGSVQAGRASAAALVGPGGGGVCASPVKLNEIPKDVESDPTKKGYDPALLRNLGAAPSDVFSREPRNEIWASGMEGGMGAQLLKDLRAMFPEIRGSMVECRTSMCVLSWDSMQGEFDRKVEIATMLTRPASSFDRRSEDGVSKVYLYYRPRESFPVDQQVVGATFDASDPQAFSRGYSQRRSEAFANARQGKFRGKPVEWREKLNGVEFPE